MCTRQVKSPFAGLIAALLAATAFAADDCAAPSSECVTVGGWNFSVALGAGGRTNPLVHGAAIPLVVIPHFSYYGKRVFIDNLDFGLTLAEDATQTLAVIASPGYDRVFFYRSDLQNFFVGGIGGVGQGVATGAGTATGAPTGTPQSNSGPATVQIPQRARRITYLAGPEWTFKYHGVSGQLDFLHEVTGRNRGDEIRAALGIPLVESGGSLTANIGITWKSAAIVNYYYAEQGIYEGGWALDPFVKLGYSHPLSGKWKFTAFAHVERLGSAIAASPIIAHRYVSTVFMGTAYAF